ncbi:MAG: redoxin domain-containing protein [Solirubrobacterales bacterium]
MVDVSLAGEYRQTFSLCDPRAMRPPAADIAVPPFPPDLAWIGGRAPRIERVAALAPVLVHFFDFAQLNSARTLPYLRHWHERYRDAGLVLLGVHSPRFTCTASPDAVATAVAELGIPYPVGVDSGFRAWRAYGCEGWPSLFLWGRGGALRWFHFGEGEYAATEEAIQGLIAESRELVESISELPEPLAPLRATDAPGALVIPPSEELFPGGSASEPWEATAGDRGLEVGYAGGGAYVTADGEGTLEVAIDGRAREPIAVRSPGLHELALHERHGEHGLVLDPSPGVRVWSISFAAGVP